MDASSETLNTARGIEALKLLGGRLCLDFVNSVDPRVGKMPRDFLSSYDDLVKWSQHVGVSTENKAQRQLHEAAHSPDEASATFEHAIVLREALYRIFTAIAHGAEPRSADLKIVRNAFVEAMTHARLMPGSHGFVWDWSGNEDALERVVWAITYSAVELLTSEEVKRVKECPGRDCGWLFLDMSKNGSRQWCSMEGCGSRAKMRRQYARKRRVNL